jgi:hypothetical protein
VNLHNADISIHNVGFYVNFTRILCQFHAGCAPCLGDLAPGNGPFILGKGGSRRCPRDGLPLLSWHLLNKQCGGAALD